MSKKLKVGDIIGKIEVLLEQLKGALSVESHDEVAVVSSSVSKEKFRGLTKEIYELVEEGFFDQPKTISDLQKRLKDRAINKKTTDLMSPLTLLISKKVLDRNKPETGIYNYFKK